MFRAGKDGYRARQCRAWIEQFSGVIDCTADFAGIAILIGRSTLRASALNITVGQKHRLDRIKELFDFAHINQTCVAQRQIDSLREFNVLWRVRRVPVVEPDIETVQAGRPFS